MTTTLPSAGSEKLNLLSGLPLDVRYLPPASLAALGRKARIHSKEQLRLCGSAWKRDPGSGVIGVEKGPLIPVV